MKHIRHSFFILIFLILGQQVFCQPPGEGQGKMREKAKEKVEALRVAYITNKLELTEKESEKFWPIYNEFKVEEKALRQKFKTEKHSSKELTEKEAEALLEKRMEAEQARLDLKVKYMKKMKSAIPASKILKLERAEKSFRAEVMKRMKDRREKARERRGGNRKGPPEEK